MLKHQLTKNIPFFLLLSFQILILFSLHSVSSTKSPWKWIPIDWRSLPPVSPTDLIEYVYLVGPLMEWEFHDMFAFFNLYHAGLGIRNVNTSFEMTLNYDALVNVWSDFLPEVKPLSNGSAIITWHNNGGVLLYKGIYRDYWHTAYTVVAHSTGQQFTEWLKNYLIFVNTSHPWYNLFNVYRNFPDEIFVRSFTCMDFVWESLTVLLDFGGVINQSAIVKSNYVNFYTQSPPLPVDYWNDRSEREKVDSFFQFIEAKWHSLSYVELLVTLLEMFEGEIYIRHQNRYLKLFLTPPYFDIKWVPRDLPHRFKK